MLNRLRHDLLVAVRRLLRTPGFTAVVVATLALGIGANAALFSVVSGVLLRPFSFPGEERVMRVFEYDRELASRSPVSLPTFRDWRAEASSFASLAAFQDRPATLAGVGEPEHLIAGWVSPSMFDVLGLRPALGRPFLAEEEQRDTGVAILSHGLWVRRFGARLDALGKSLSLDGRSLTVVGVLPAGFSLPPSEAVLWTPLVPGALPEERGVHGLRVIGRLSPGASLAQAQAEMSAIARRLETAYPDTMKGYEARVVPFVDSVVGAVRPRLLLLLGAVGFVLLICCANVANLLLARFAGRRREVAVRAALGASRTDLARQSLAESLLLAAGGGIAGVALAAPCLAWLRRLAPGELPRLEEVTLDARALGLTAGVVLVTGLLLGLAPAWQAARAAASRWLRESVVSGGQRLQTGPRSVLVVGQVAAALVLVLGAGWFASSFLGLLKVDPGFEPAGLLTLRVSLPESEYAPGEGWPKRMDKVLVFQRELLERLETLSGVESAALAYWHPLAPGWTSSFNEPGGESPRDEPYFRTGSPGYLRTVGTPLVAGRWIGDEDGPDSAKVVVVNEAFVRRYWPGERALGRRIQQWGGEHEVVGVVGDERFLGVASESAPALYFSIAQRPMTELDLLLRTEGDPTALARAAQEAVWAVDPKLAAFGISTLDRILADSLAQPRLYASLLGLFGSLALLLAMLGLYGLLSYLVAQRTPEIGVRMALGAGRGQVLGLVVRQGMLLFGAGSVIGLAGAWALRRALASLLTGPAAGGPALAAAVALLGLAAFLACLVPALRAARLDAVAALRGE